MPRTASRRSLTDLEVEQLIDHVEDRLLDEPCDTSLRHAEEHLARHGFDIPAVTAWLNRRGAYCDCEILMNVDTRGWERL